MVPEAAQNLGEALLPAAGIGGNGQRQAVGGIQQPLMRIPPFDDVRADGVLDRRLGAIESRLGDLVFIGKLQVVSKIIIK